MTIRIPIISEFDNKGFKKASIAANLLTKEVNKLGKQFIAAFSARQIYQFSKRSIQAFVQEDKAVQALSRNLQNLRLGYDVRPVENYIRSLQYATGVSDEELRPALQQLVTTTKNLVASQDLLSLALDISAGTGKSLTQVTQALSRAYLGTTTSLARLNVGLSKADLKAKSFDQITEDLSRRFSGQAAQAAKTYAGQLGVLSAVAQDAQEILGQKLLDSIRLIAGEQDGVLKLAKTFEDMANYVGDVALGLGSVIKQIKTLGGSLPGGFTGSDFIQAIPVVGSYLEVLRQKGSKISAAEEAKKAAIARATSKELGTLASRNYVVQRKTTSELAKQQASKAEINKLSKAASLFDQEKIQIEAALQGKLTEQERLRLEIMKAVVNENGDKAATLADKLKSSESSLGILQRELTAFKPYNPFQEWEDSLATIKGQLGSMGVATANVSPNGAISSQTPMTPTLPLGQSGYIPPSVSQQDLFDVFGGRGIAGAGVQSPTININVSGTGDLSDDTKQRVVDAVVEASSYGIGTNWFRTTNKAVL